jgi:hypothetical protein
MHSTCVRVSRSSPCVYIPLYLTHTHRETQKLCYGLEGASVVAQEQVTAAVLAAGEAPLAAVEGAAMIPKIACLLDFKCGETRSRRGRTDSG